MDYSRMGQEDPTYIPAEFCTFGLEPFSMSILQMRAIPSLLVMFEANQLLFSPGVGVQALGGKVIITYRRVENT